MPSDPTQTGSSASNEGVQKVISFPGNAPEAPASEATAAAPARAEEHPPVWMQRTFLVIFVVLCIEFGLVLIVVPWTPAWTSNSLLGNMPRLRTLLDENFVRGAISGLGLMNIWLAISEAVHYRDRR